MPPERGLLTPELLSIDWTGQEGFSFSQAYSDALLQPRIRQSLAKHGDVYQGMVIERENRKVHIVQSLEIQGNCTGFQVSTPSACITVMGTGCVHKGPSTCRGSTCNNLLSLSQTQSETSINPVHVQHFQG